MIGLVLRVLTAAFWVAAPVLVVAIVAYSLVGRLGAWLLWTIGASLVAVAVSSGLIAWVEFAKNPMTDAERGEWTNKMLFYALVFTASLFVGFLYLPTLFIAR